LEELHEMGWHLLQFNPAANTKYFYSPDMLEMGFGAAVVRTPDQYFCTHCFCNWAITNG
jgi:hypothetical protein